MVTRARHHRLSPPGWWAIAVGLCVWLVSATAAASPLCDEVDEPPVDDAATDDDAMTQPQERAAPCGASADAQFGSPRYNACFMANRLPATSAPAWLAEHLSKPGAMSTMLEQVRYLGDQADGERRAAMPGWLARSLEQWEAERGDDRRPPSICLENDTREACGSLPSPAVLIMAGTFAPATTQHAQLEIPWRPGESQGSPEIPTILPVGPSEGHPLAVDRPPESSHDA